MNLQKLCYTDDIAEATSIIDMLKEMVAHIKKPIYFVLGNHDYYRGKIVDVREKMRVLTQTENLLYWLPASSPTLVSQDTVLLGQDGWADGRYGDYANSNVVLNDSRFIHELFQQRLRGKGFLYEKMQALADSDTNQLRLNIADAINRFKPKKIIVLTHVPPFKETCRYEGKISNDNFLPFFSSKATGDVLLQAAKSNQSIEFLVLCGHTHCAAQYKPLKNLFIKVGQAEYYQPEVQEVVDA